MSTQVAFVALVFGLVVLAPGTGGDTKTAGKFSRLRNKLKPKWKLVFVGYNTMASMPGLIPNVARAAAPRTLPQGERVERLRSLVPRAPRCPGTPTCTRRSSTASTFLRST